MVEESTPTYYILAILSFIFLTLFTGCGSSQDSFITPRALIKLTQVPSGSTLMDTLDALSREVKTSPLAFSWKILNKVGVELRGYTITYKTAVGERLPTLDISFRPAFVRVEGESGGAVNIDVFHRAVADLMLINSFPDPFLATKLRSSVSPVVANVTLFFEDDHKHKTELVQEVVLEFGAK